MTDTRETAERIVAEFQAREDTGPACDLFVWLRQAIATALRTARDEALEEAVQAATSAPASATTYNARLTIAKRIRALASKDEQR